MARDDCVSDALSELIDIGRAEDCVRTAYANPSDSVSTAGQDGRMSEREMDVELVGGPADWAGRTLRMRVDPDDPEAAGAYLISAETPPRSEDEDTDPRAIYEPDPAGPVHVWRFRGWFPAGAGDPSPADYLSDAD